MSEQAYGRANGPVVLQSAFLVILGHCGTVFYKAKTNNKNKKQITSFLGCQCSPLRFATNELTAHYRNSQRDRNMGSLHHRIVVTKVDVFRHFHSTIPVYGQYGITDNGKYRIDEGFGRKSNKKSEMEKKRIDCNYFRRCCCCRCCC